ncbi:CRISPR-associated CARF protein Csa3 [Fervidicoccus fontis]|uniref:Csa3 N-terminal domain-containing protein n=1 Tax=Fervidicoccus fontis (strain DSM 19380 / JCM 18336 / VKM B-2539 / Kam940) TaxID=1163730 RepID=I0A324_FERFK|nr:CRISPR-associated CARF protein Csa3 [Fervidicoccus fontis]AFH43381.1 hypothetical protein FFONT_1393 [Fervidicoccus fontis Kam940]
MERCFIINIGFHADVGLRRITDSSIKPGEKIILISGPENPSSGKALSEFKLFATKAGIKESDIKVLHLDLDKPWESAVKLADLISKECSEGELVLELGGGMRGTAVLILLSAIASGKRVSIETTIEGSPQSLRIPWGFLRFVISGIGSRDGDILEALYNNRGSTPKDISRILNIGEKTIVNRITKLKKMGFIEKRGRGLPSLTPWGEAAAMLNSILKDRKEKQIES